MSTHSNVFVELVDGSFSGTHCHFDGGPRHCGQALYAMSHDRALAAVAHAQATGGFRQIVISDGEVKVSFNDNKRSRQRHSDRDTYLTLHETTNNGTRLFRERYVYVKRRGGGVDMVVDLEQDGSPVFARLYPQPR